MPSYSGEHSEFSQYTISIGQFIATYLAEKPHHNLKDHDHILKCTKDPVLSSHPYILFLSLIGAIFPETLPVINLKPSLFHTFVCLEMCKYVVDGPVVMFFILLFEGVFS